MRRKESSSDSSADARRKKKTKAKPRRRRGRSSSGSDSEDSSVARHREADAQALYAAIERFIDGYAAHSRDSHEVCFVPNAARESGSETLLTGAVAKSPRLVSFSLSLDPSRSIFSILARAL